MLTKAAYRQVFPFAGAHVGAEKIIWASRKAHREIAQSMKNWEQFNKIIFVPLHVSRKEKKQIKMNFAHRELGPTHIVLAPFGGATMEDVK